MPHSRTRVFSIALNAFDEFIDRRVDDRAAFGYLRLCAYMTSWGLWDRAISRNVLLHSIQFHKDIKTLKRARYLIRASGAQLWYVQRPPAAFRPRIPATVRAELLSAPERLCGICRGPIGPEDAIHIDHIMPFSRGGPTDITNLQLAHMTCNIRKGARVGLN